MPTAKEILEGKVKEPKKEPQTKTRTIYKENKKHKEAYDFLLNNKDTFEDVFNNAINTIKKKDVVLAKDKSKKYYRDFVRYTKVFKKYYKIIEEED